MGENLQSSIGGGGEELMAEAFLLSLSTAGEDAPPVDELEAILAELLAEATAEWPDLSVEPPVFASYLAERIPAQIAIRDRLRALTAADLYLCCACCSGDPAAIGAFEATYVPEIELAMRRVRGVERVADEVKQVLRQRLLVSDGGKPPRIAQYSGQGPLVSWIRVAAVREALRLLRRSDRERPVDNDRLISQAADEDQELTYLKQLYKAEFRAAFTAALDGLSSRDRNLLKYRYLDDLNIDQIGHIFGVHRATVARWLATVRQQLLIATRTELTRRLRVSGAEFESIMRLIHSQLHLSLQQHLQPED